MRCSVAQIHHLFAGKVTVCGSLAECCCEVLFEKCSMFLFHRELIWTAVPVSCTCMTLKFFLFFLWSPSDSVSLSLVCLLCEGRCDWGSTRAYLFNVSPTPDFLAVKHWSWHGSWLKSIQQGCASVSVLLVCCSRAYRRCTGKNPKDEMDLME